MKPMPSPACGLSVQNRRWHVCASTAALEMAAVQAIMRIAQQSISARRAFHIVLAGGTTPRRVYESLRACAADWSAWHVYFGDERCLPIDDPERNSLMAARAWLDHVAIPRSQIFPIAAERGAATAAADYASGLAAIDLFDLVLLGLGEDGHTASLFPNRAREHRCDEADVIAVLDAPKPPPQRVSLSARRLSAARQVIFLVSGATKRQAVADWRRGVPLPAAAIKPAGGVDIYIDAPLDAAAQDPTSAK